MTRSHLSREHAAVGAIMLMLLSIAIVRPVAEVFGADVQRRFDSVSVGEIFTPTLHIVPTVENGAFRWRGVPLLSLIRYAYDLSIPEIEGKVPAKIYEVNGEFSGQATEQDVKGMIRELLRDRFSLRTRTEARTMSAFRLVVGPGGHRLPAAKPPYLLFVEKRQLPPKTIQRYTFSDTAHFAGAGVSVRQFAVALANHLRRPVVDRTGLDGIYNFDVVQESSTGTTDQVMADLRKAIEQTGLRLEEATEKVELLIIEQIRVS